LGSHEDDDELITKRIREQARTEEVRVTQHALQEMVEDGFTLDDVLFGCQNGEVLENYPEHRRGACCLLWGRTRSGRAIHVVCTTERSVLIIITVYEPKPPKWRTPTQRR
jgi:hypothetical protein